MVKVAAIQMNSTEDVQENIAFIKSYVLEAAKNNVSHIFLPETANFIHPDKKYCLQHADVDGAEIFGDAMSSLAKEHGVFIHVGSVKYRVSEEKLVNRSLSFAPTGVLCAWYDKIHLFDVTLSEAESYMESNLYNYGENAALLTCKDFTLGYSICYDLRFPELYFDLAQNGANIIVVPSAFTVPTGEAHWESLLRARAIETGSYIIAAAQVGIHCGGRRTYGHSMIISPWGEKLSEVSDESVHIIYADIDIQQVITARSKVNSLKHRRNYGFTHYEIS